MQNVIITLQGTGSSLFNHVMTKEEMKIMFSHKVGSAAPLSFDDFQDKLINIINRENVRVTVSTSRGNEIFSLWNSTSGQLFNHIESNSRLNKFIKSFAA